MGISDPRNPLIEAAACECLPDDPIECRCCQTTQYVINRRDAGAGLWVECTRCHSRFLLKEEKYAHYGIG